MRQRQVQSFGDSSLSPSLWLILSCFARVHTYHVFASIIVVNAQTWAERGEGESRHEGVVCGQSSQDPQEHLSVQFILARGGGARGRGGRQDPSTYQ